MTRPSSRMVSATSSAMSAFSWSTPSAQPHTKQRRQHAGHHNYNQRARGDAGARKLNHVRTRHGHVPDNVQPRKEHGPGRVTPPPAYNLRGVGGDGDDTGAKDATACASRNDHGLPRVGHVLLEVPGKATHATTSSWTSMPRDVGGGRGILQERGRTRTGGREGKGCTRGTNTMDAPLSVDPCVLKGANQLRRRHFVCKCRQCGSSSVLAQASTMQGLACATQGFKNLAQQRCREKKNQHATLR
jgi:hypothetical protein